MRDIDCVFKVRKGLYARGNTIKRKFSNCSEDVKLALFRCYCSSFYCCALWSDEDSEALQIAKVCHNNIFRYFIKTKFKDSISRHFIIRNTPNFDVIRRKALVSFYRRMIFSQNELICISDFTSNCFKTCM